MAVWTVQLTHTETIQYLDFDSINNYGLEQRVCDLAPLQNVTFVTFDPTIGYLPPKGECRNQYKPSECLQWVYVTLISPTLVQFEKCFNTTAQVTANITKSYTFIGFKAPDDISKVDGYIAVWCTVGTVGVLIVTFFLWIFTLVIGAMLYENCCKPASQKASNLYHKAHKQAKILV
jgi:hypothetical protein